MSSLHCTFSSSSSAASSPCLSLLIVSHLFFVISTQGWSSFQGSLLLTIVSGVVNQVFLWIRASFTLFGFQCSQNLARRPGNQQVHQQVCQADDKAYWRTTAAPCSSKLSVWTVMPSGGGGIGMAHSISFTQTNKTPCDLCCCCIFWCTDWRVCATFGVQSQSRMQKW